MTTSPGQTIPTGTDLRARRESIVREHVDAESRRDIPAALATFATPHYEVVPFSMSAEGAPAVTDLLRGLFDAFPDFSAEILELHHADTAVFVDLHVSGTQQGTWAEIPASGRRMDLRMACLFHFDADRLVKETIWFDHGTILAQISGEA